MNKITLEYAPRPWALPFHASTKRWMVLVIHRRAGKTTAALNFLQVSALRKPSTRYAFIAPTYKQAKNVAWDLLKRYARVVTHVETSESTLTVLYPNGSKITLFGADDPDSLRGMGFSGVVFDEYSQQPSNIFSEIIRPALADQIGYAVWIGTPKGRNEFWRLYEKHKSDDEWLVMKLAVNNTSVIKPEELESARKNMSEDEYEQEWNCSFDAAIKGAYYALELSLLHAEKRIRQVPYDPAIPVHTVWDLGIADATAIGFYQRIGAELRKIDYLEFIGKSLTEIIAIVKNKSYVYGKHFAPHDIEVREYSTGKSRFEIAKNLGIRFEIVPKLSIADGINAGRTVFQRLWVDEIRCAPWLDAIAQYKKKWNDSAGAFEDEPNHDWTSHAADEFRYAAIVESKMTNDNEPKMAKQFRPDHTRHNGYRIKY